MELSVRLLEGPAGDPSVGTSGWEHGTALGLAMEVTTGPLGRGLGVTASAGGV
jgi:hypothetical protein